MATRNHLRAAVWLVLLTASSAFIPGCSFDIVATAPVPDGDDEAPRRVTVTVRFRNLAVSEAVDVGLYVSNEVLEEIPEDLFSDENRITASIGVAGTGIIEPLDGDVIELDCSENLVIGIDGGSFLDNETGEARGMGTVRWLREGPLALCGGEITFVYLPDSAGFRTTVIVDGR